MLVASIKSMCCTSASNHCVGMFRIVDLHMNQDRQDMDMKVDMGSEGMEQ